MTSVYVVETPAGQFAREGVRGNERGGQRRGDILVERHLRHVRWVVERTIAGRRCAMRARRPNNGLVMRSVFVGRGVRVGVPRRAAVMVWWSGGWHGRRYGYDVGLLGAAGRARRDKPAVAIGVASACRCSGEGTRGGVEVVCCVSQEGGVQ